MSHLSLGVYQGRGLGPLPNQLCYGLNEMRPLYVPEINQKQVRQGDTMSKWNPKGSESTAGHSVICIGDG